MTRSDASTTALMPLRNYEPRFLQEALDSIFGQTSPSWELLIIVEPEDVQRLSVPLSDALCDPRVHLIPNQGRKLAGAFTTGMRTATTDFLAILLSDDRWAPHAVSTLEACIRAHPEADFFHSARRIIDGDGRAISSIYEPPDEVRAADFIWTGPVKHLLCWRRAKALAFGGMDETLNSVGPDDYDFPWLMLEHGAVFVAVHECLYEYRDHREGVRLTTHLPRSVHLSELRRILTKHGVRARDIRKRLRLAKKSYLQQCLYRNELDRWLKEFIGYQPAQGRHEKYR